MLAKYNRKKYVFSRAKPKHVLLNYKYVMLTSTRRAAKSACQHIEARVEVHERDRAAYDGRAKCKSFLSRQSFFRFPLTTLITLSGRTNKCSILTD